MVLLAKDQFYVIKAAILGSILATMVLCLGFCFLSGGLGTKEQTFSAAVSEAGSGLLLTAYVQILLLTQCMIPSLQSRQWCCSGRPYCV